MVNKYRFVFHYYTNKGLTCIRLCLVCFLYSFSAHAQTSSNHFFDYSYGGFEFHYGSSIGNTFQRIRDSRPMIGELYYQKQMNAVGKTWMHTKRAPQAGIAFLAVNSGSIRHIGAIICLTPFINLPLYTLGSFAGNIRIGFGIGWVQKTYANTNKENLLVSTPLNTQVEVLWQNQIRISSHSFINAGIGFFHLSNGKINLPNLGINIPLLSIGYRYAFKPEFKRPQENIPDIINKKNFIKMFFSLGIKEYPYIGSAHYLVNTLSTEVGKQISNSSIVAAGLLVAHDGSLRVDTLVKKAGPIKNLQSGVYGLYEYKIGRISIPVQLGTYILNSNSAIFECVGVRYQIKKNFSVEYLLKAHKYNADVMQIGFGYIIK